MTNFEQFSEKEVKNYQAQLKEIDAERVDGHFVTSEGQIPAGNEEVSLLLDKILAWSEIVLERWALSC